jgi:hypothetical protein
MFLGSKAAHETMISPGAAPAGMDMHGRAGKPKQLAKNATNPWKTSRFERRGQEPNNPQIPWERRVSLPRATRNTTRAKNMTQDDSKRYRNEPS